MPSPRFLLVLALTAAVVPNVLSARRRLPARPLPLENNEGTETIYSACYPGQEMCVKAHSWEPEDLWECVDTQKSSKNCGGCTQPMQHAQPLGRDCTIIPGQKSVSCVRGECVISKCQSGWQLSKDQGSCYELYDEGD